MNLQDYDTVPDASRTATETDNDGDSVLVETGSPMAGAQGLVFIATTTEAGVLLTPDQARRVAAGLVSAADAVTFP